MISPCGILTALAAVALSGGLAAGCTSGGTSSTPAGQPSAPAQPGASGQPGLAGLSAKQILSQAVAAATAAGSLHFSSQTEDGSSSLSFSDASSPSGGRQVITMSNGGQMTVIVVSGTGYVNGNAAGLSGFLGLPAQAAQQLAGQWLEVTSGSQYYQQVVSGVTTSSVLSEFSPAGTLSTTREQTVDGQAVVGVHGSASASSGLPKGATVTLYVAATGKPLPVSCVESASGDTSEVTFSQWGVPVSVAPPAQAIPMPAPSTQQSPAPPGFA